MFRTKNPALNEKKFQETINIHSGAHMTVNGTVQKTALLLLLALLPATYIWDAFFKAGEVVTPLITGALIGGSIVGFILAIITVFSQKNAMYTAPIYAIAEGFVLGALSAIMEASFPGIVLQAVMLTFGVLFLMLVLYRTRIIKVTEKFRLGVFAATGAIMLVYLVSFIMSFFGTTIPMIHSSGTIGIIFSLVVVGIAALNLTLDFDMIEKGSKMGAAKYMEWYGAFGIMVTLVWLYIEILRLLAKLRGRD